MQPIAMATDNGPHTPETWGRMTAERVFPLVNVVDPIRLLHARRLQGRLAEVIAIHVGRVQAEERRLLTELGDRYIETPHNPAVFLIPTMRDITFVVGGTLWEDHFQGSTVQGVIQRILAQHYATVQSIERLWYIARSGPSPAGVKYQEQAVGAGGGSGHG